VSPPNITAWSLLVIVSEKPAQGGGLVPFIGGEDHNPRLHLFTFNTRTSENLFYKSKTSYCIPLNVELGSVIVGGRAGLIAAIGPALPPPGSSVSGRVVDTRLVHWYTATQSHCLLLVVRLKL